MKKRLNNIKVKFTLKLSKKIEKCGKKVEKEKSEKLENFFLKNNQLYLNECICHSLFVNFCQFVKRLACL